MNRDFKGIWIPKRIWFIEGLKPQYRIFLAEIDSLDNGEGCFAENGHFSELFGLSKNRCSEIINSLGKMGFLTIKEEGKHSKNYKRIIRVNDPFGKSTTPSEFRQPPSESRQPPSENRQLLYKEEKYNEKYNESNARALDFLKSKNQEQWEAFQMEWKKQIKDWQNFVDSFNDKFDEEELAYNQKVIKARLSRFARNWQRVEKKSMPEENTNPYQHLKIR